MSFDIQDDSDLHSRTAYGPCVAFDQTGGGLTAREGPRLEGFSIAVRYAWADNPVCNLSNRAGLPASPFRTDVWPSAPAEESR